MPRTVDLHQHLWPEQLVEALRRRDRTPYLRGWTVYVDGEPPYRADPAAHDVESRLAADRAAGVDLACVSLSSPLGIEGLPPAEAHPLLEAWHAGAAAPGHLRRVGLGPPAAPDVDELAARLAVGFVGVQLPATAAHARGWLDAQGRCSQPPRRADRPVLVHPGPPGARPQRAGPSAGRRSSTTRRSCRRPGGPGTRSAAARLPRLRRGLRRRRRARSAPPGAAHGPGRRQRVVDPGCSSTPRRTDRGRSTPWCGCSASTPSSWAATGRTPLRSGPGSARRRRSRSGQNPERLLGRRSRQVGEDPA